MRKTHVTHQSTKYFRNHYCFNINLTKTRKAWTFLEDTTNYDFGYVKQLLTDRNYCTYATPVLIK